MKKILALGVGVVLAWAPAGPAFAAPQVQGTGNGKALGNCGYSSATGVHAPFAESAGNGNGGHAKTPCVTKPTDPVDDEQELEEVNSSGEDAH